MNKEELVSNPHIAFLPLKTILLGLVIFALILALLTGATYKFYASFLFLFYSFLKKMWISIILLGIFQTILMIPTRIISLKQSMKTKEFEAKIEEIKSKEEQHLLFKKGIKTGDINLLWHSVNFTIQTVSYFSLGRLFLTDFYNKPLDRKLLYSFVSYPHYPIKDIFFKIPYPFFNRTINLGMDKIWLFVILALIYKVVSDRIISYHRKMTKQFDLKDEGGFPFVLIKNLIKWTNGSLILIMVSGLLLIRYFPVDWELRIFSGDVSRVNSTLNLITAIMTVLIIIWLDFPKIAQKIKKAQFRDIEQKMLNKMQIKLFKDSLQRAILLGLGAYFITNAIPCAFELSIFTLEIISFLSPFTLDKLIFKFQNRPKYSEKTNIIAKS